MITITTYDIWIFRRGFAKMRKIKAQQTLPNLWHNLKYVTKYQQTVRRKT